MKIKITLTEEDFDTLDAQTNDELTTVEAVASFILSQAAKGIREPEFVDQAARELIAAHAKGRN